MKLSFFLTAIILFSSGEWLTDFDSAKQRAQAENKKILVYFSGSDWCGPCIQMKREVFEQAPFVEYASKNLVLVRADFPRNKKNQLDAAQKAHNEKLAEKYNPQGDFPLTLLLDGGGNVLFRWDGYASQSSADFVKELDQKVHGK
jgi:thioredoxin-related protein